MFHTEMDKHRNRSDIRKRNLEIIEKANAELRTEQKGQRSRKTPIQLNRTRDLSQLCCSFNFHINTPHIDVSLLHAGLEVESGSLTTFVASDKLLEPLRTAVLVDDSNYASLDLFNAAFDDGAGYSGDLDDYDIFLLNDVVSDRISLHTNVKMNGEQPPVKQSRVETAHFLRRPQILTGENSLLVPAKQRRLSDKSLKTDHSDMLDRSFEFAESLSGSFRKNEALYNPVSKSMKSAELVLEVLPLDPEITSRIQQIKYDENPNGKNTFDHMHRSNSILLPGGDPETYSYFTERKDADGVYVSSKEYISGESSNKSDEFFILSFSSKESGVVHGGHVGKKLLLRKTNTVGATASFSLS